VERVSGWDDEAKAKTRPIGDVLDNLGIEATLEPDELVAGVTRLSIAHQGIGWIERVGMLRVAETIESGSARDAAEDD
jgi:hypothetical protein